MRRDRRPRRPPREDPNAIRTLWCPYSGDQAILETTARVYSADYIAKHPAQPIYLCPKYPECDSYVGVHKGTLVPLGRMANRELRKTRSAAYRMLDALWKAKMKKNGLSFKDAKMAGLKWLAEQLGVPPENADLGSMDVDECRSVVAVCLPYFKKPEAEA